VWTALLAIAVALAWAVPAAADQTVVKTGRITSTNPDWVYVPVNVPAGTREIAVSYSYNRDPGNTLDIGIFDSDGIGLGNNAGFRGWSGGARSSFTISRSAATPGYRPGRIEPGTWNVILGPYQVGPTGIDYRIEITLRSGPPGPRFVPRPPREFVPGPGRGWYRGDLHVHTVHSDGQFLPGDAADRAVAANLDFFFSSEHNTDTANSIWDLHRRPGLLVIGGEEITTRAGHWNALGLPAGTWIDWRYRPSDGQLGRFTGQVRRLGGLSIANHPTCPLSGCGWLFGYRDMDLIEVWNGPWDVFDNQAIQVWENELRSGNFIPLAGASDAHRDPQVIGLPQTVVRAVRLSRTRVLAGLARGRSYVAESAQVALGMKAFTRRDRAGIGRRLRARPGEAVSVRLRVGGAAGAVATLHTEDGVVATSTVNGNPGTVTAALPAATDWVRAEVRRTSGGSMVALTNPIFIR